MAEWSARRTRVGHNLRSISRSVMTGTTAPANRQPDLRLRASATRHCQPRAFSTRRTKSATGITRSLALFPRN